MFTLIIKDLYLISEMFSSEMIHFVVLCHSDKFQSNVNFSFHFMIINVIWRFLPDIKSSKYRLI